MGALADRIKLGAKAWANQDPDRKVETITNSKGQADEIITVNGRTVSWR
jgi:hypothetical protein